MREILFKAKKAGFEQWEEGCYAYVNGKDYIVPWYASAIYGVEINPKTLSQYTGLRDSNNQKIFENDIVTIENTKKQGLPGVIVYNRLSASFELAREGYNSIRLDYFEDGKSEFVVVGNIFDKGE